ncbi:MAG: transposase [Oscillospiraceae bacterium]|nr:transposase [Oscillospiraceae bacterium]
MSTAESVYKRIIYEQNQTISYQDKKIAQFESGEAYVLMKKAWDEDVAVLRKEIRDIRQARLETEKLLETSRENWFEQIRICAEEYEKKLAEKDRALEHMKFQLAQVEEGEAHYKELYLKEKKAREEAERERAEIKDKYDAAMIRLSLNHNNSGKDSKFDPNHPPITVSSRKVTGKSRGGQKKHHANPRPHYEPTETEKLPTPEEFLNNPKRYYKVEEMHRQVVDIYIVRKVKDYVADVYMDRETGKRVHAEFPPEAKDDTNYGDTVKAFAFLLHNELCASLGKTRLFMAAVLDGLTLSQSGIHNLAKEFARKTEDERKGIFDALASAPVLNGDYTYARVAGFVKAIAISYANGEMLFQAEEHRGNEGLKDTPIYINDGTLVCDGEFALVKVAGSNQQCWAHLIRYLILCTQVEGYLKWPFLMLAWITRAIAYINSVKDEAETYSKDEAKKFEAEYDSILKVAEKEYKEHPPRDIFKKGENLYNRMLEKESLLRFLYDLNVPPTNNICEQGARKVKIKLSVAKCFQSFAGLDLFCRCLTILESTKLSGGNLYEKVKEVFARK